MLERSDGIADLIEHHLQVIQETAHVCLVAHLISQKTTLSSVDYVRKLCCMLELYRGFLPSVKAYILTVL
jgi:hypothetical protein